MGCSRVVVVVVAENKCAEGGPNSVQRGALRDEKIAPAARQSKSGENALASNSTRM